MSIPFGLTNRGRYLMLQWAFPRAADRPASFFMALVTKVNQLSVNAAPAVNEGTGLVGIPVTGHGYTEGQAVKISGTVNYNGRFIVNAASSTDVVVIEADYVAETFDGTELIHRCPGPDDSTLSDVSEIVTGNGYDEGGLEITPDTDGFDILTQDDTNDLALTRIMDLIYTAAGGSIPPSGDGARYAVLTDDNATVANRQIIAVFDLVSDRTVPDGQTLTLIDATLYLSETV